MRLNQMPVFRFICFGSQISADWLFRSKRHHSYSPTFHKINQNIPLLFSNTNRHYLSLFRWSWVPLLSCFAFWLSCNTTSISGNNLEIQIVFILSIVLQNLLHLPFFAGRADRWAFSTSIWSQLVVSRIFRDNIVNSAASNTSKFFSQLSNR